jgi:hypothetical protein
VSRKILLLGAILSAFALSFGGQAGLWLTWSYPQPMPVADIVFVILSSTNLPAASEQGVCATPACPSAGFTPWMIMAAPPVPITPKPREFFLCYASNTVSHCVSGFNAFANR